MNAKQKMSQLSPEEIAHHIGVADGIKARGDEQLREDAILWLKWHTGEASTPEKIPDEGEMAAYLLKRLAQVEDVLSQVETKIEEPLRTAMAGQGWVVLMRELAEILHLAKVDRLPTWEEKVRDWYHEQASGLDTAGDSEADHFEAWFQILQKEPEKTMYAISQTLRWLGKGNEEMVGQLTAFLVEREDQLGLYLKERHRNTRRVGP